MSVELFIKIKIIIHWKDCKILKIEMMNNYNDIKIGMFYFNLYYIHYDTQNSIIYLYYRYDKKITQEGITITHDYFVIEPFPAASITNVTNICDKIVFCLAPPPPPVLPAPSRLAFK